MELPLWRTDLENMVYIIRDEGTLPLGVLVSIYGEDIVAKAQTKFMSGLRQIMEDTFTNATVIVISANEQIKKTYEDLANKKTISLDTFYKGTYNLDLTRLFKVVDGKTEFIKLTSRGSTPSIEEQLSLIEPGEYTLVDDDAVGGRTIKSVKEMLPQGVTIVDIYLMMDSYRNKNEQPVLDVIDCRDFMVGIQGCGLTTLVDGVGVIRLPYMYPFVDIDDKANIPCGMEKAVSKKIWELNKEFWSTLNPNARLIDTGGVDLAKMFEHYKLGNASFIKIQKAINKLYDMAELGVIA